MVLTEERAITLMFFMGIYSWLFPERPSTYARDFERAGRLDLPFSHEQYDGIVFADEI